jgi:hypothetical protein
MLQERKPTSNGVGHVGKEYALLAVSLMDYDLNAATVLPQTKTVDAVASAHDKHVGISPDGVLLVVLRRRHPNASTITEDILDPPIGNEPHYCD